MINDNNNNSSMIMPAGLRARQISMLCYIILCLECVMLAYNYIILQFTILQYMSSIVYNNVLLLLVPIIAIIYSYCSNYSYYLLL